jgi:hypothetical protein
MASIKRRPGRAGVRHILTCGTGLLAILGLCSSAHAVDVIIDSQVNDATQTAIFSAESVVAGGDFNASAVAVGNVFSAVAATDLSGIGLSQVNDSVLPQGGTTAQAATLTLTNVSLQHASLFFTAVAAGNVASFGAGSVASDGTTVTPGNLSIAGASQTNTLETGGQDGLSTEVALAILSNVTGGDNIGSAATSAGAAAIGNSFSATATGNVTLGLSQENGFAGAPHTTPTLQSATTMLSNVSVSGVVNLATTAIGNSASLSAGVAAANGSVIATGNVSTTIQQVNNGNQTATTSLSNVTAGGIGSTASPATTMAIGNAVSITATGVITDTITQINNGNQTATTMLNGVHTGGGALQTLAIGNVVSLNAVGGSSITVNQTDNGIQTAKTLLTGSNSLGGLATLTMGIGNAVTITMH